MVNIGIKRLESQIRIVVSEGIQRKLNDPRLERMASITRVEVSSDLSFADVSVSVMGTEGEQRAYMTGLKHAHGVLQKMVARNLQTRTCPTLRFHLDQSIKKGIATMKLIEKSETERAKRESESGSVYVSEKANVSEMDTEDHTDS
jgi:ribosome-binding factor A